MEHRSNRHPLLIDPATPRSDARERLAMRWFPRDAADRRPSLVARWGTVNDTSDRYYPTAA